MRIRLMFWLASTLLLAGCLTPPPQASYKAPPPPMPGMQPQRSVAMLTTPKPLVQKRTVAPEAMRALVQPGPSVILAVSLASISGGPWAEFGLDRISFTNTVGNLMLRLHGVDTGTPGLGLSWDVSSDPDVVGYNVYYGPQSRSYTNVYSARFNAASLTNLVSGATYYIAVTAYDIMGLESDYSGEISYTPPDRTLTVTRQSSSSLVGPWKDYPPSVVLTNQANVALQMAITKSP